MIQLTINSMGDMEFILSLPNIHPKLHIEFISQTRMFHLYCCGIFYISGWSRCFVIGKPFGRFLIQIFKLKLWVDIPNYSDGSWIEFDES